MSGMANPIAARTTDQRKEHCDATGELLRALVPPVSTDRHLSTNFAEWLISVIIPAFGGGDLAWCRQDTSRSLGRLTPLVSSS